MRCKLETYWSFFATLLLILTLMSCKKYLNEKPQKQLVIPNSTKDIQALLDNDLINSQYYALPVIISDEFFVSSSTYNSRHPDTKSNYCWDKDATFINAWRGAYRVIYYANVALEELPKVKEDVSFSSKNDINGQALFHRAVAFYYLAQLYCKPFSYSASTDLGIALRLSPDIELESTRATVSETYDRIINDLSTAAQLLPEKSLSISRPNKAAVFGALARVYLSMRDYDNAGRYADSFLVRYNSLMDFNLLDTTSTMPIVQDNPETVFHAIMPVFSLPTPTTSFISNELYESYDLDDLRRVVFFRKLTAGHVFKGSYSGVQGYFPFCGIATDEMYLIRAESYARLGNTDSAMANLNRLMITRWRNTVPFPMFTASTPEEALNIILSERRKELIYRGTRWMDLRRLNLEGANITLTREIDGEIYELPPNDPRWVMLIPLEVISLTEMQQNPR